MKRYVMKKRMIATALFVVVMFVGVCSTGTTASSEESGDVVNTPETPEAPVEVLPVVDPPPETVAVEVERRPAVPVIPMSDVQEAPSFYVGCFSALPRERREARSRFNRYQPEVEIIRRGGTPGLLDVTRLVLGRIILSEANWIHDDRLDHSAPSQNHAELDAGPIYQVLRYTRRNGETLLGSMRRHAPHVSESRPIPSPGRHRRMVWVTEIQLSCRRPAHFPTHAADGGELNWERDYRPRCLSLFTYAQRLLEGDASTLGEWGGAPLITWGGRCEDRAGACDDSIAVGRGLVPFETGATANRFWCRPGATGCTGAPPVLGEVPVTSEEVVAPEVAPVYVPVEGVPPEEEISSTGLSDPINTAG